MKIAILTLAAALSACSLQIDEPEVTTMTRAKLSKADASSLKNLPAKWSWVERDDYWAAMSDGAGVSLSPDRTMLRIRGALGTAAAAQLWQTVAGVLEANALSPVGYDLKTFRDVVRADVIAEVGRHPDYQQIGLAYPVQ